MIKRIVHYLMDNYPAVFIFGTGFITAVAAMAGWKLMVYLIFVGLT